MKKSKALEIKGLHKAFHGKPVLQGLKLEVAKGELCVLIGRSGCGKSTLLRCLNGLEKPDKGSLRIAGLDLHYPSLGADHPALPALRRKVGMVFQNFQLFPHLTVEENLMAAPHLALDVDEDEARERAEGLLEKVGLSTHSAQLPHQLSGGQQQRAAIARALAVNPEILLYDEPTSSLDPHLTHEVLDLMVQLKKDGVTQVIVTHEHAFARRSADKVVFLEEGRVIEQGKPRQIFSRPRDRRTKKFIEGFK